MCTVVNTVTNVQTHHGSAESVTVTNGSATMVIPRQTASSPGVRTLTTI